MRLPLPFCWQPRGVVSSLEELPVSSDVPGKEDVTLAVSGKAAADHRLIVAELAGGKVIGDLRLVATRGNLVIGGVQAVFGSEHPSGHYLLKRRRFRMDKKLGGTAFLLGAANSDNYYHWMLDSLPRWQLLRAAGWRNYDHVLLHSNSHRFQEETLNWLEVPDAKRLRCSKNFVYQFEKLVVPAMPFPSEQVQSWACSWLRSIAPADKSGPKLIYLSRSGGFRRRLQNETELQKALESEGFVTVQPSELTVAEQARLLTSAECVVAPHGAALTNMVFAPAGALLFELFHPKYKPQYYKNLAAACGHRYVCLEGTDTGNKNTEEMIYVVDIPAILEKIKLCCRY